MVTYLLVCGGDNTNLALNNYTIVVCYSYYRTLSVFWSVGCLCLVVSAAFCGRRFAHLAGGGGGLPRAFQR